MKVTWTYHSADFDCMQVVTLEVGDLRQSMRYINRGRDPAQEEHAKRVLKEWYHKKVFGDGNGFDKV